MFSDEKPKRVFKFIQLALLAKLIDEVVLFALALPSLDDAATSVGPRALSRIDAENNRPDWQLEFGITLKMFRSYFQRPV